MHSMNCVLKWQEVCSVVLSAVCTCCVSLLVTSGGGCLLTHCDMATLLLGGYLLILYLSVLREESLIASLCVHVCCGL